MKEFTYSPAEFVPFRDTETGYKFFRRETVLPLLDEIEDEALGSEILERLEGWLARRRA